MSEGAGMVNTAVWKKAWIRERYQEAKNKRCALTLYLSYSNCIEPNVTPDYQQVQKPAVAKIRRVRRIRMFVV